MLVSNRHRELQPKAEVLNADGKGRSTGQVDVMELNESEELNKRRQPIDVGQNPGISLFLGTSLEAT